MARARAGEFSLKQQGIGWVAVARPTKSMFKQLAGDTPLCEYMRQLAVKELNAQGQGGAFPGQENFVSSNTLSSVKADTVKTVAQTSELMSMTEGLLAMFAFFVNPWGASKFINAHGGKVDTSFSKDKAQITALASKLRQVAQTIEGQLSMPDGGGIVE